MRRLLYLICPGLQLLGIYTMWGPRSIAKLVPITPITMVYGTDNYSIHGVYKPTYNWGAPHCIIYIYTYDWGKIAALHLYHRYLGINMINFAPCRRAEVLIRCIVSMFVGVSCCAWLVKVTWSQRFSSPDGSRWERIELDWAPVALVPGGSTSQ